MHIQMLPAGDPPAPDSMVQPAELDRLAAMQEHLASAARQFGIDQRRTEMLSLALEEIFVNICHYAYPDGPGPVVLSCRSEGARLIVEIVDQGQPFDPSTIADPDLTADLATRKIGGLGWLLVRRLADDLDCFREDGRNVVRLTLMR